ncbi:MAG: bifunctional adenosylcobinamide kinase/adenosylcobinamide-phosphate guanylyltransferase [Limimaricola sp.]|uniref:bifunctional adenosylcobinamide kinase/adenosylcobinamide-phosphate guanylyltransferase n=1 Tax=Limimaricola sp. TaxID=2211665 RepID=UPI001D602740|nr:bifunctional adenosylcobinamide kinase/adenosylcobinamide-phosphate guanylyltransferase [Limimaricola sp.]MBI1417738.1 bifunctional adenosylcobinamide kinase/adenosylcobinamide-phosphate guanylyltransferase [Limimaricola sp.]
MDLQKLTVVTGGAASGKSAHAEGLALASVRTPRIYIATAQAWDDEMKAKVATHRDRRGSDWVTIEAPYDLPGALEGLAAEAVVLIDCATLWLTNHLLAEADLDAEAERLLAALAACPAPVIVVTNEVGQGIVPDNALARRFRNAQGRLNQRLAAAADTVVAVISGLPLVLKGAA